MLDLDPSTDGFLTDVGYHQCYVNTPPYSTGSTDPTISGDADDSSFTLDLTSVITDDEDESVLTFAAEIYDGTTIVCGVSPACTDISFSISG